MKETENLKKLFHKPNFFIWAGTLGGTLLIIAATFFIISQYHNTNEYTFKETKHGTYQPKNKLLLIIIDHKCNVWIEGRKVKNKSEIPILINEELIEHEISYKKKVLLKVNENVRFGMVVEILKILKKANIEVVGLITKEHQTYADFMFKKK